MAILRSLPYLPNLSASWITNNEDGTGTLAWNGVEFSYQLIGDGLKKAIRDGESIISELMFLDLHQLAELEPFVENLAMPKNYDGQTGSVFDGIFSSVELQSM